MVLPAGLAWAFSGVVATVVLPAGLAWAFSTAWKFLRMTLIWTFSAALGAAAFWTAMGALQDAEQAVLGAGGRLVLGRLDPGRLQLLVLEGVVDHHAAHEPKPPKNIWTFWVPRQIFFWASLRNGATRLSAIGGRYW